MIITCPRCEKKFEVDSNLIPEKGRMLKCGSCDQTWLYEPRELSSTNILKEVKVEEKFELNKENNEITPINEEKNNKSKKIKKSSNFGVGKILSYLIVTIISFVALIIILETFKSQLGNFFPGLEFMLYSLYETIEDIFLFLKNLFL